ncbi:hypothetical protein QLR68_30135, partial [Micromonospora sp. DH15]|nr:hypothetical protein [Micromonospora sp. DH15]
MTTTQRRLVLLGAPPPGRPRQGDAQAPPPAGRAARAVAAGLILALTLAVGFAAGRFGGPPATVRSAT